MRWFRMEALKYPSDRAELKMRLGSGVRIGRGGKVRRILNAFSLSPEGLRREELDEPAQFYVAFDNYRFILGPGATWVWASDEKEAQRAYGELKGRLSIEG